MIQPETEAPPCLSARTTASCAAIFDAGGTVDTVAFHQARPDRARPDAAALFLGWQLLSSSLTDRQIGQAATLNALANQSWLPKPAFPAFLRAARRHPVVAGVNVAHSRTVAGVFFCQSASQADREGHCFTEPAVFAVDLYRNGPFAQQRYFHRKQVIP